MNRGHSHSHHHHGMDLNRAFGLGVLLNVVFVIAEGIAGWWAGSLALLTDAGHNLSDVLGLLLAWGASWLGQRKPSERRTYGYSRATIMASVASALLLLLAVGAISWEAFSRLGNPAPVAGPVLMLVAGIGVVINAVTAALFHRGKDHDLNVRGAYLHMAADAAVSLGVVVAGALIFFTGWHWLDPVTSLLIAAVIFLSTWGLLRDSVNLAFDAVPAHVDIQQVRAYLNSLSGVKDVHDLHIWAMSTTETAMTAHLVMPDKSPGDAFLFDLNDTLSQRFGIEHSTIQIEQQHRSGACGGCE